MVLTNFGFMSNYIYLDNTNTYSLSDVGSLCKTEGKIEVLTKEDCRKAVKFIPNAKDGVDYDQERTDRPHGCFLHTPNDYVHWNPHTGSPNRQDKQVCTATGKCLCDNRVAYNGKFLTNMSFVTIFRI